MAGRFERRELPVVLLFHAVRDGVIADAAAGRAGERDDAGIRRAEDVNAVDVLLDSLGDRANGGHDFARRVNVPALPDADHGCPSPGDDAAALLPVMALVAYTAGQFTM